MSIMGIGVRKRRGVELSMVLIYIYRSLIDNVLSQSQKLFQYQRVGIYKVTFLIKLIIKVLIRKDLTVAVQQERYDSLRICVEIHVRS